MIETPTSPTLFTIGYGNRSPEAFFGLLAQAGVGVLADVRSVPVSKFRPQFSRAQVEALTRARGLRYVYMGHQLGGMPQNPACYRPDGSLDPAAAAQQPAFQQGLARLALGLQRGHRIALMCAELSPVGCHRGHLLAPALLALGIGVVHIGETGQHTPHAHLCAKPLPGLFE